MEYVYVGDAGKGGCMKSVFVCADIPRLKG